MTNWRWKNFAFLIIFHVLSMSTATGNIDNTLLNLHDGNSLDQSVLHSAVPKPQSYDTTVPLLLEGRERRPLSQLKSTSHPASLKLVVEAEGEQLVLALEKNEGLFASHYTETHYLEDGSAVTGAHNYTKNCYYHGEVEGHANSDVTLSTCSGLRGFISLENKTFILEPSLYQDNNKHIIYRGENLNLSPGTCGHGFNMSSVTPNNHLRSPFRTFSTRVKLIINYSII